MWLSLIKEGITWGLGTRKKMYQNKSRLKEDIKKGTGNIQEKERETDNS